MSRISDTRPVSVNIQRNIMVGFLVEGYIIYGHIILYALLCITVFLQINDYWLLIAVGSFLVRYRDNVMKSVPDVRTLITLTQQLMSSDKVKVTEVEKFSPDDVIKNSGKLQFN